MPLDAPVTRTTFPAMDSPIPELYLPVFAEPSTRTVVPAYNDPISDLGDEPMKSLKAMSIAVILRRQYSCWRKSSRKDGDNLPYSDITPEDAAIIEQALRHARPSRLPGKTNSPVK
jgi:hypothetical protein